MEGDKSVFNLANYVTATGIVLTVWLEIVLQSELINYLLAFSLVILACASDGIDGKLARSRNEVTSFGSSLDKARDKFLTIVVFKSFLKNFLRPAKSSVWLAFIKGMIWFILVIEGFLIFTWMVGFFMKRDISAHKAGKIKTILYFSAIVWWFLFKAAGQFFQRSYESYIYPALVPLLSVGVFFAILSLVGYLQRYYNFNEEKKV